MSRGDELIEQLLADGADEAAVALLSELHGGYAVERLRTLLGSANPAAAKAGAWLASELGDRAAPLLDDVPALLAHPERYVRFFALDVVLTAATPAHGAVIARGVERCADPDGAVRWKAMRLLARATGEQLNAAVPHLADERMRRLTAWLARPAGVAERLADPDALTRRFAVAAAVRTRSALDVAAASPDPEIATFADDHAG